MFPYRKVLLLALLSGPKSLDELLEASETSLIPPSPGEVEKTLKEWEAFGIIEEENGKFKLIAQLSLDLLNSLLQGN